MEEEKEVKKCSNCGKEWEESHKCEGALEVNVKDTPKAGDKFGK